ncbi:MAG: threonine synthase [Alphaproteobacteria bacterium]
MRYVSTRGQAPTLGFEETLLAGLAADGGLYVPETWPRLDFDRLAGQPYNALAEAVLRPYVGEGSLAAALPGLIARAYAGFRHPAVTPLREIGDGLWLMELFHGPTLAFKDVALQLLGHLFDAVLSARGERVTIVGATSGDTGSAAIEACRGRKAIDIFILHPRGRTSEVQRRQMTTVDAPNVHNVAVEGTFDDCQDLVKAMFGDAAFRSEMRLSAVNSINWARVAAQIVYYVRAGLALGRPGRPVSFAVPTGNFGNVLAAYAAGRMGLPIGRLIVGSNRNDILARFLDSGRMAMEDVAPTLSPSMDIQVSSNFERLLFDMLDRDGAAVAGLMRGFRASGAFEMPAAAFAGVSALFAGARFDDAATIETMRRVYRETGELVDPHTAVGIAAAWQHRDAVDGPVVVAGTAHPAKFPDAVERATGVRPALPPFLADLYDRPEHYAVLPNDLAAVQRHIRAAVALDGAA